jgi:hypothetical protein
MLDVETIDLDVVQAALHLADTIARSDPNVTESWKVDIGPFRDVVMAHRRQWDHRVSSITWSPTHQTRGINANPTY